MDNFTSSMDPMMTLLQFSWVDYTLFVLMFGVSAAIGVYFGFFDRQDKTAEDYLLGGREMNIFPIAMSLVASHLSGVTLLGVPSEIYFFGINYAACFVSAALSSLLIIYCYLPVFYKLQASSSYEYLQVRFDSKIRTAASLMYATATCLHVPIVIYIPALALNQVTGLSIHYVAPAVSLVCIFYTTIGGLKAVVWTDTLQFMVTIGSMVTVFGIGIYSTGGFGNIWERAEIGGRTAFDMGLDPTTRISFWSVSLGMGLTWVANLGVNPSSVQRFLAVPSISDAKRSVVILGAGVIITKFISCFSGLIMYAYYKDCDPYTAKVIRRRDQLLPYYVLDVAGNLLGLPGLFISGVFSTALSTMSANLNTLAGTIFEDFIEPNIKPETSQKHANTIMKYIVVIVGLACLSLVFLIDKLGGVLDVSIGFHGMTQGPLLGLFTLGMFFRSANAKGALWGSVASIAFMIWVLVGHQMSVLNKALQVPTKPLSISGCDSMNITIFHTLNATHSTPVDVDEPFWLYKVSVYWYTLMGASVLVVVGLVVSWFTKEKDHFVEPTLLTPAVKWLYNEETEVKKEYLVVPQTISGDGESKSKDESITIN